jgi:hypothetical protein
MPSLHSAPSINSQYSKARTPAPPITHQEKRSTGRGTYQRANEEFAEEYQDVDYELEDNEQWQEPEEIQPTSANRKGPEAARDSPTLLYDVRQELKDRGITELLFTMLRSGNATQPGKREDIAHRWETFRNNLLVELDQTVHDTAEFRFSLGTHPSRWLVIDSEDSYATCVLDAILQNHDDREAERMAGGKGKKKPTKSVFPLTVKLVCLLSSVYHLYIYLTCGQTVPQKHPKTQGRSSTSRPSARSQNTSRQPPNL